MLKKHSFERAMARAAVKLIGNQLLAMLIYVVMILVVMVLFADEDGYVYPWNEMFATLFTLLVVLGISYQPIWLLGEEHAASLHMHHVRGTEWSGLQIGLLAVSPIIVAWFFDTLLGIFSINAPIFNTILAYMLYPWEPYFNVCKLYMDTEAWYMPLIYLPAIVPIPLFCHWAYRNGCKGITFKSLKRAYQKKREAAKATKQ